MEFNFKGKFLNKKPFCLLSYEIIKFKKNNKIKIKLKTNYQRIKLNSIEFGKKK